LTEHQQREAIHRRDELAPSPRLRGEGRGEEQAAEPEG